MTGLTALGIILAHLFGDFVLQSHWMANEKTKRWAPAVAHVVIYTACYVVVTRSILALAVIGLTHLVIDRYRLARHIGWLKNQLAPARYAPEWPEAKHSSGYPNGTPEYIAFWLMIIVDNAVHLAINTAAVAWL